jgi:Holliday junction resolvase
MNSNAKGKTGERDLAKLLRDLFGVEARRSQQYCGKAGDADLITSIPGSHWEAKNYKNHAAITLMEQAADEAREGEIPVLALKRTTKRFRGKWFVLVAVEDLIPLVRRIEESQNDQERLDPAPGPA